MTDAQLIDELQEMNNKPNCSNNELLVAIELRYNVNEDLRIKIMNMVNIKIPNLGDELSAILARDICNLLENPDKQLSATIREREHSQQQEN